MLPLGLQDPAKCAALFLVVPGGAESEVRPRALYFPPLVSHPLSVVCGAEPALLPLAFKSPSALEIYCVLIKLPERKNLGKTCLCFLLCNKPR